MDITRVLSKTPYLIKQVILVVMLVVDIWGEIIFIFLLNEQG